MGRFAILLGGEVEPTDRLRTQLSGRTIIAADSGIEHARLLGLEVHLWVGDFDSASEASQKEFAHVPREEWSSDKDMSDGEIAIDAALGQGASSILLVGAFGGRADFTVNHLLASFSMPGEVILTSGTEEALPLRGETTPDWSQGTVFSILAFDDLEGVTIKGARWPLDNVSVRSGASHTISNEVAGALSVSVKSGRAMLVGSLKGLQILGIS